MIDDESKDSDCKSLGVTISIVKGVGDLDLFNPKNGRFAKNIRDIGFDDTSELRESMENFGWHKEWPAIVDENDVVLVGHRRLKVAKQLGIEPVIKKLTLGQGGEADAERLKLAIISNIGGKAMTSVDRKRIAEHLYGKREWTMQRIAEALGVSHKTISKDLDGFVPEVQTSRPEGGRPKGSKAAAKLSEAMTKSAKLDEAKEREIVAGLLARSRYHVPETAADMLPPKKAALSPDRHAREVERIDARNEELEQKLDAANQRISELEQEVKPNLKAIRKQLIDQLLKLQPKKADDWIADLKKQLPAARKK